MILDSGERTVHPNGFQRTEEWRPVVGYEEFYEVSNFGRVRSKRRNTRIIDKENRIMCQKFDDKGYLRVNLSDGESSRSCLVSRLVAMAFIPNQSDLPMVGHDDDNKENNHVSNLYWTDADENTSHNGLREKFIEKHREKMYQIIEKLSVPVIGTNVETGEEIYFSSMQEAGRGGFDSAKVSMCCSGRRQTHGGYKWRKQDDFR